MKDYPISCIIDGTKTVLGGSLAFYLGLVGGSLIVFSEDGWMWVSWEWIGIAWIALIPYTIAKLWGLILTPMLVVIFYGLVWQEWNRLVCSSLVALLLSGTTLICAKQNPFDSDDAGLSFIIAIGCAMLVLITGIIIEFAKRKFSSKRPDMNQTSTKEG